MEDNLNIGKIYSSNDNFDDSKFWESIYKVKAINDEYYKRTGKRKISSIVTYGCQMNELILIFRIWKIHRLSIDKPVNHTIRKLYA